MAGREARARSGDKVSLVSIGSVWWAECVVEMRFAASGSGESAYIQSTGEIRPRADPL